MVDAVTGFYSRRHDLDRILVSMLDQSFNAVRQSQPFEGTSSRKDDPSAACISFFQNLSGTMPCQSYRLVSIRPQLIRPHAFFQHSKIKTGIEALGAHARRWTPTGKRDELCEIEFNAMVICDFGQCLT